MILFCLYYSVLQKLYGFGKIKQNLNTHSEVQRQMKKSQLITLVIMFVAVSIFIWVGACDDDTSNIPNPDSTISIQVTPSKNTAAPTATPEATAAPTSNPAGQVDFAKLSGLSTNELDTYASFDSKEFTDSATTQALADCKYLLSNPGNGTNDVYLAFLLHYSDVNPRVEKLLDLAKDENVKFTFFVSSMYLNDEENAETIKKIYKEGHTIGSRGDKSIDQLSVSAETLADSLLSMENRLKEIVGQEASIKVYSPDKISQRNAKLVNMMGYTVTFKLCNFVTDSGSRDELYNGIQFQSSEISDKLVTQVTSFVEWATAQGYTFKGF